MARLMWAMLAVILAMAGYLMLRQDFLGQSGYVVIGVGIGVGTGVAGSLGYDLLAGSRERIER